MVEIEALGRMSDTALTRDVAIRFEANGLPNTFVPGRNLLFLTFAAAAAYRRGSRRLVIGVCETDYSGYPDCRDDTMKAMQVALNLGMDSRFVVETPLMWIDKAETWRLAERLGGAALVEIVRLETHSCYHGDRERLTRLGLRLRRMSGLPVARRGLPALPRGPLTGERWTQNRRNDIFEGIPPALAGQLINSREDIRSCDACFLPPACASASSGHRSPIRRSPRPGPTCAARRARIRGSFRAFRRTPQIDLQGCGPDWCSASWRNLSGYIPAFAVAGAAARRRSSPRPRRRSSSPRRRSSSARRTDGASPTAGAATVTAGAIW